MWKFESSAGRGFSPIQLQAVNCTPSESAGFPSGIFSLEARQHGAIALHISVTVYLFFTLAIVCDHFFVPAIERLAADLKIPSSVAGASLMAAAASIPNLATNIIGSLVTHDDIGIGAVVGSSFFNVLFIPGAFTLSAWQPIQLTKWPVLRDLTAYIVSSVLLAIIIIDRQVEWYESLALLLAYVTYLFCLIFDKSLEQAFCWMCYRWSKCCNQKEDEKVGLVSNAIKSYGLSVEADKLESKKDLKDIDWSPIKEDTDEEKISNSMVKNDALHELTESDIQSSQGSQTASKTPVTDDDDDDKSTSDLIQDNNEYHSILCPPSGCFLRFCWIVMFPAIVVISIVIPDFKRPGCCKYTHYCTLLMSVIFIGLASYVLVWMISITGDTFGIPSSIMGMTLLAAGGSLPDCLNSIFAARKGYGDMAFSNAIGSNMFDILFCLSIPWLLDFLFIEVREPVPIYANMTLVTIFLLTSGVLVLLCTAIGGWRINKKMAVFFIVAYLGFIAIDCAVELRNELPPCV